MKEVKFVDIGEGITEGHLIKWLAADGSEVKEDQPLAQIETDKAVVNVPSPTSGIIKIAAKENADVRINELLAYVGSKEELEATQSNANSNIPMPPAQAAEIQAKSAAQQSAEQKAVMANQQIQVIATPFVRKLARDMNVDILKVLGTGQNSRVSESDVRSFAASISQPAAQAAATEKLMPPAPNAKQAETVEQIERIPLTQTRKAIARNMEESWKIPRAVHMDLIDATALYDIVSREKSRFLTQFNAKLTFLPFIIKAAVEALIENPRFNASYDAAAQEMIIKKYYNIGIAAEASDGLKVIVLKDCDKKSIKQLAQEIQGLHNKLNDNTITMQEMKGNTFTITSIGSLGGGFLSVAMINPPDVAILAVHFIKDMPVAVDGKVEIRKVLPISITFDHRAVDGADAVKFGNAIKAYIEDPDFLEIL
ncbi:MAG: 2-oxo acid dehydrogenase subunit E2 [Candidatus Marsarchaeota archaeon]|nr:2-oxo acid dehydrogenase subunit E2 [Candidatus Marsarchaeota archaeon]